MGSSESTHVKIPRCWKSHVAAQMTKALGLFGLMLNVPVNHFHPCRGISWVESVLSREYLVSCSRTQQSASGDLSISV